MIDAPIMSDCQTRYFSKIGQGIASTEAVYVKPLLENMATRVKELDSKEKAFEAFTSRKSFNKHTLDLSAFRS